MKNKNMDAIDMEAEREGVAIRKSRSFMRRKESEIKSDHDRATDHPIHSNNPRRASAK